MGSCASIEHVQEKSSACVEVLRKIAHEVSSWFHVRDFNRGHTQVSINADIAALCFDLSVQKVHTFTCKQKTHNLYSPRTAKQKTGVRDILLDGMEMLTEKSMYEHWLWRTGANGSDLYGTDPEAGMMGGVEDFDVEPAFANSNGRMEVDSALDPQFEAECPFTNL
jgi:hypothetical protein